MCVYSLQWGNVGPELGPLSRGYVRLVPSLRHHVGYTSNLIQLVQLGIVWVKLMGGLH